MMSFRSRLVVLVAACLALVPNSARAQSAIAGIVKDASGAVLPGVSVEASSDALIEKSRAVTTDGAGQYKVVDLRPGVYVVTFSLSGFQTIKRQAVELPADFTATINAEMKVGAIEESVTVLAASPVVDVQSASHMQVLNREAMDEIPTGRTIQSLGQLIVGVNLSLPDTAGARGMQQTYMSTHGQSAANNTVMVDGMMVNGLMADGAVQSYFNDAMSQEVAYQTSGIGAETSAGGVRLNMIPKEGGNRFSGTFGGAYRPGKWQGDNLSDRLKAGHPDFVPAVLGLTAGNATDRIEDFTGGEGGPIVKNILWFYVSGRYYSVNNFIAQTFTKDGGQGIDDQFIKSVMARVTWQVSPRNKFSAYDDEIDKYRGHDMQALFDPDTAATVWNSPAYHTNQAKWTSTVTNKLMIDAGFSSNLEYYTNEYREGIAKLRGTADWFAGASRSELDLGGRKTAATVQLAHNPARYNIQAAASYVTGSHNIKVGFQRTWGTFTHSYDANADLTQQYRSNATGLAFSVPNSVVIRNTPLVDFGERLNYDFGIFAQDAWTMRRLTINAGLRWEALKAQVLEGDSPAGRFVPARHFDAIENLPSWKDWAPRFSAVYDLRGDAKTALKFSLNRYNQQRTTGIADNYNALVSSTSASLAWTDLNKDDIAQGARGCAYLTAGCEINFAQLSSNFGTAALNRYGNYPRTWNLESAVELQHELLPRLSVSGAWFHGSFHNLTSTYHTEWTYADYTPVQIFNPISGTPITVYNRSVAANSRPSDILDSFDPERQRVYNSYSFEFNARPGGGARIFGGLSVERELNVNCTQPDNPNFTRFCDERHLEDGFSVPFRKNLRLAGSIPVKYGITVSGSLQSNRGVAIGTAPGSTTTPPNSASFAVGPTTRYPTNCPAPCPAGALVIGPSLTVTTLTVPLVPYLVNVADRINQLDVKASKTFRFGRASVSPSLEMFNLINPDQIVSYVSTSYATSSYLRPNSIVQGRILGLSVQTRW
jgi:Carboxypeptidase regulatory-like domain